MVPQDGRISAQEKKSRDMVRCTSIFARDDCLQRLDGGTHFGLNEISIDEKEQPELNEAEENVLKSLGVRFL